MTTLTPTHLAELKEKAEAVATAERTLGERNRSGTAEYCDFAAVLNAAIEMRRLLRDPATVLELVRLAEIGRRVTECISSDAPEGHDFTPAIRRIVWGNSSTEENERAKEQEPPHDE